MARKGNKYKPQTAAEFMAKLEKDPDYQKRTREKEKEFAAFAKILDKDEKKLVKELRKAGFPVTSVWDFANRGNDYLDAVPILIKHLKMEHHPRILAGIARSLAMPELADNEELWNILVDLYINTLPDKLIDESGERGLQQGVALALEIIATPDRILALEQIVQKYPEADGIDWIIEKLKKLKNKKENNSK